MATTTRSSALESVKILMAETSMLSWRICSFGLGSLISMLGFIGLGMVYRQKLNQQREECRELVTRLLETRLGKPVTTPLQENRAGEGEGRTVRVANEVNESPARIQSAAG